MLNVFNLQFCDDIIWIHQFWFSAQVISHHFHSTHIQEDKTLLHWEHVKIEPMCDEDVGIRNLHRVIRLFRLLDSLQLLNSCQGVQPRDESSLRCSDWVVGLLSFGEIYSHLEMKGATTGSTFWWNPEVQCWSTTHTKLTNKSNVAWVVPLATNWSEVLLVFCQGIIPGQSHFHESCLGTNNAQGQWNNCTVSRSWILEAVQLCSERMVWCSNNHKSLFCSECLSVRWETAGNGFGHS